MAVDNGDTSCRDSNLPEWIFATDRYPRRRLNIYSKPEIICCLTHLLHFLYFSLLLMSQILNLTVLKSHIYLNGSSSLTGFQGNNRTSTSDPTSSISLGMFYVTLTTQFLTMTTRSLATTTHSLAMTTTLITLPTSLLLLTTPNLHTKLCCQPLIS